MKKKKKRYRVVVFIDSNIMVAGGQGSHGYDAVRDSVPELLARGGPIQLYICLSQIGHGLFGNYGLGIHSHSRYSKCFFPGVTGTADANSRQ